MLCMLLSGSLSVGGLTYDTIPLFHKLLFTITLASVTIVALVLAIFAMIIATQLVSDWLQNLLTKETNNNGLFHYNYPSD